MGKDIFLRRKAARADRRFLGSIRGNTSSFEDHDGKFCLERFHDWCFFNQQESICDHDFVDDEPGKVEPQEAVEERRIYWESQESLLQEILEQYHSIGPKLREQIKRQIDIARESNFCNCLDKNLRGCIKCLRRAAVNQLSSKGFSAALCVSEWKRTHKTPGGLHEYIEVIASTQGRRKQIPFLVELGFWDEFRMAKGSDEYNKLINQLPEIYIGKSEHLNAIIRLVCGAAKKSTQEQKIHMGPWRKSSFMQMKWSASSERRLHHHSSNELWISSAPQESVVAAASSFQLPMATTVKVA